MTGSLFLLFAGCIIRASLSLIISNKAGALLHVPHLVSFTRPLTLSLAIGTDGRLSRSVRVFKTAHIFFLLLFQIIKIVISVWPSYIGIPRHENLTQWQDSSSTIKLSKLYAIKSNRLRGHRFKKFLPCYCWGVKDRWMEKIEAISGWYVQALFSRNIISASQRWAYLMISALSVLT